MVGRQPPSASTVEMVKVGVNVVIVILDADFTYTAAAVDTLLVANVAERLGRECVWISLMASHTRRHNKTLKHLRRRIWTHIAMLSLHRKVNSTTRCRKSMATGSAVRQWRIMGSRHNPATVTIAAGLFLHTNPLRRLVQFCTVVAAGTDRSCRWTQQLWIKVQCLYSAKLWWTRRRTGGRAKSAFVTLRSRSR